MQFVERDLWKAIGSKEKEDLRCMLPAKRQRVVTSIMRDLAEALRYLHIEKSLVHNDIKVSQPF